MLLSKLKESVEIFIKYGDDNIAAEHDEIFICAISPEDMLLEDADRLDELGWNWDDSLPSWRRFV